MEGPLARATSGSRAPFQVLVIPFHLRSEALPLYCLFRRSDAGYWRGLPAVAKTTSGQLMRAHRGGGRGSRLYKAIQMEGTCFSFSR